MKQAHSIRLMAEVRESFLMAMSAVASHKLRSSLTLLGVLIGVFSIILVMTAMRAMQNKVEKGLGQLGSRTFAIQKMPGIFFGGPEGIIKYLRRKEITLAQAMRFKEKVTLPAEVGIYAAFSTGDISSRYGHTPPNVAVQGATPGVIQANNWLVVEGRPLTDAEVEAARDVCLLTTGVAKTLFPFGSAIGQRVKIAAISYRVIGVIELVDGGDDAQ